MWWILRHTVAILILPVTVVVVVPVWIASSVGTEIGLPGSLLEWAMAFLGLGVLAAGGLLFLACLVRFGVEGKGTLAPWDPPVSATPRVGWHLLSDQRHLHPTP